MLLTGTPSSSTFHLCALSCVVLALTVRDLWQSTPGGRCTLLWAAFVLLLLKDVL